MFKIIYLTVIYNDGKVNEDCRVMGMKFIKIWALNVGGYGSEDCKIVL